MIDNGWVIHIRVYAAPPLFLSKLFPQVINKAMMKIEYRVMGGCT
jgi:hypothetical protein